MKKVDPTIQAHAEMLVRKIQEVLARFPDTPVIECRFFAGDQYTLSVETLTLDIGGERESPDRLVITFQRRWRPNE